MGKTKKRKQQYIEENPIEKLLGGSLDQLFGTSTSGEKQKKDQEIVLFEGQEVNLREFREEKTEKRKIEAGIDYLENYSREISYVSERAVTHENREIEAQLRELMAEIKRLADSSKDLQMQFKEIAVEQHATKPGKYHKSFFSWLLSVIRAARAKVEDSNAWLQAMHSKKKSREYGAMAKKHGTSFSLSNERNVATQVG